MRTTYKTEQIAPEKITTKFVCENGVPILQNTNATDINSSMHSSNICELEREDKPLKKKLIPISLISEDQLEKLS